MPDKSWKKYLENKLKKKGFYQPSLGLWRNAVHNLVNEGILTVEQANGIYKKIDKKDKSLKF